MVIRVTTSIIIARDAMPLTLVLRVVDIVVFVHTLLKCVGKKEREKKKTLCERKYETKQNKNKDLKLIFKKLQSSGVFS